MTNITPSLSLDEIVKPMERGQITIPIKIREKLKITSKTWLWVKLVQDKILIETVEKESSPGSLSDYLLSFTLDSQAYWKDQDTKALEKVNKKSKKRLKGLI